MTRKSFWRLYGWWGVCKCWGSVNWYGNDFGVVGEFSSSFFFISFFLLSFLSFFFILQFAKEMTNMITRWKIGLIYRSITRSFLFFKKAPENFILKFSLSFTYYPLLVGITPPAGGLFSDNFWIQTRMYVRELVGRGISAPWKFFSPPQTYTPFVFRDDR